MTAPAIPAATLVVMRERTGGPPELLMVERTARMAFAGGAMVFPGGRIDDDDRRLAEALPQPDASFRIAAIREMGRVQESSFFTTTLVGIARSETDPTLRDTAIVTLGRTGARVQLRTLYTQLPESSRIAVLTGLFNAKDDDELIRIASTERNQRLRTRARQHLKLLGTPKAVKFLEENPS